MAKRKLKELNLLDDFLFGTMIAYPEIGERFSREILKIIFQREFGKLTVVPQKVYYGSDTDKHGARLDVYLEEENEKADREHPENAVIYDIEPDKNNDAESRKALPKRMRFYHAMIDGKSLKAGESYHNLKRVIIIMIMPYDPCGADRMVYTIRNTCIEDSGIPYDDGAMTLLLYTKGKTGNPREELRQLLCYMENTTRENAVNPSLKEIQQMVDTVKQDKEVSLEYMKIFEREEMLIRQGRREEQANTDRERKRADAAEQEAAQLREELENLRKKAHR